MPVTAPLVMGFILARLHAVNWFSGTQDVTFAQDKLDYLLHESLYLVSCDSEGKTGRRFTSPLKNLQTTLTPLGIWYLQNSNYS